MEHAASPPASLSIDTFLPYMRDVVRCEQSLRELNLMWRMIEASAKMNCPVESKSILPTIAATRSGFSRLEEDLVTSLVREKVTNVLDEIGTRAQYVVDIVVRNLYERTADVGFLATDQELCAFVAGVGGDAGAARQRLRAYRDKYTVYDEIMLLDTTGNVLAQIDESSPVEGSADPLIQQTLSSGTYVETFRATDLRPGKPQALIYSRRMLHPRTGAPVGVLCLCFHFEEEMAGIFRSHRDPEQRSNMLLLDGDNRVISSADERWIPVGAIVPINRDASPRLTMYGGREYLVRSFAAAGYQGYMGPPGWQGQVMVPVEVAFTGQSVNALGKLVPEVADGLLSHASSFCPPLHGIMVAADTIRRVVWNGQVMTAGRHGELQKLKMVLEQISETGMRSNELFSRSIRDLYETVLASSLRDMECVARLLVDLVDRNLYERSNDCRWWALTPELRAVLAAPGQSDESVMRINGILAYINDLYTVYTSIFVYDDSGKILAASCRDTDAVAPVGGYVDAATLAKVRGLRSGQDYHASAFEASALYAGRPTYVYHAAIRHPEHEARIVGGIGIVFDAEPEFRAMLRGCLGAESGKSAFFIDRSGIIIGSTDETRPVGTRLELDPALLALGNGDSASRIVVHDGHYAIMGCSASSGYREFKVSDGYRDDILALVFDAFGEVRKHSGAAHGLIVRRHDGPGEDGWSSEHATFFIGGDLFATPAEYVLEALPASMVSPMSLGARSERIGVLPVQRENANTEFVWVFDLGQMLLGARSAIASSSQVVVLRRGDKHIGLLVDELQGVHEFANAQITSVPFSRVSDGLLVKQIIKANDGDLLIQGLDVDCLFDRIRELAPAAWSAEEAQPACVA